MKTTKDKGSEKVRGPAGTDKLGELPPHVASPDPSLYWSDNYVVLDFETTTEFKGSPLIEGNRLILASWYNSRTNEVRSAFEGEYQQGDLVKDIRTADFIVAHNAKFELGWLKRCGVNLRDLVVFDTFIADHVLGGNRRYMQQLSLNACLARRGLEPKEDTVSRMIKVGVCPSEIPESWLQKYCERDVTACHELFLDQREALHTRGQEHLLYQRCLVTPCLTDIEFNGIQLDKAIVDEYATDLEDHYAEQTTALQHFCDGASPTSPAQLAIYVYDTLKFSVPRDYRGRAMLTPSGGRSVAEPVMAGLRASTAAQRAFLNKYREWKALDTAVTKYMRKFQECCKHRGGRLRAVFNQCNTRTHRLSSSGMVDKVQFQNLAQDFKKFFCARETGWVVGEIDGSQLEFRIAVHMGRDAVGLNNITTPGFDIHALTAATLGVERNAAKRHTFKPLYGGSGGTPKEQAYFKAFKATYPGITSTQRGWTLTCLNTKQFTTEYGMTFYFPDCRLTPSGYITNTTNIYNYPVQGFATAEIIPIALVCAWHRMKDWDGFLVNTVHDSIVAELPTDEVGAWHELATRTFILDTYSIVKSLYGIALTVPLGAGVTVGSHWANAEAKASEQTFTADPSLYEAAATDAGMMNACTTDKEGMEFMDARTKARLHL